MRWTPRPAAVSTTARQAGGPAAPKSRRRLVILSSQELSRYKARSPARLIFLKKRACLVVVVQQQEAGKILEAIRLADGLVFRDINFDRLAMIAELAESGYLAFPSALAGQLMNRGLRRELVLSLNPLEHRVLTMLGRGSPNRAISEALRLDEGRTKYLIRSVFKKLHLQNRTQAAVFARDVIADSQPLGVTDVRRQGQHLQPASGNAILLIRCVASTGTIADAACVVRNVSVECCGTWQDSDGESLRRVALPSTGLKDGSGAAFRRYGGWYRAVAAAQHQHDAQCIAERLHIHLSHDARTMHLDGARADFESPRHFLGRHALDHKIENFALAGGQRADAFLQGLLLELDAPIGSSTAPWRP